MHKSKIFGTYRSYSAVIKLVKRHHEPSVLLYFSSFPDWLARFSLQICFWIIKFSFPWLMLIIAQVLKENWIKNHGFLLIHKQQTNLWMKLPTIPPGLAGKIFKYRPLSEPIRCRIWRIPPSRKLGKKWYLKFYARTISDHKRRTMSVCFCNAIIMIIIDLVFLFLDNGLWKIIRNWCILVYLWYIDICLNSLHNNNNNNNNNINNCGALAGQVV